MQAEIKALQSQINPHFLVNSLNSIRFMAVAAKFPGIQNMAEALIKILSASFKTMAGPHSIRDEMELLESYVYLMGIRYSENFEVDWQIDPDCLKYSIPKLIMQPIVENAIIHGFEDLEDMGQLQIIVRRKGDDVLLQVQDDGKGMTDETVNHILHSQPNDADRSGGIGVSNVNRRLQLYYGKNYGLSIESEAGMGSLFTIRIPARRTEEKA